MNRQEAYEYLKDYLDNVFHNSNDYETYCYLRDCADTLAPPDPDPITGLVPCGCGGKAIIEKGINYHSGYYVICEKCECNIGLDRDDFLRPFGAYPTAEQAVSDWNRAVGWKGGAE